MGSPRGGSAGTTWSPCVSRRCHGPKAWKGGAESQARPAGWPRAASSPLSTDHVVQASGCHSAGDLDTGVVSLLVGLEHFLPLKVFLEAQGVNEGKQLQCGQAGHLLSPSHSA